MALAGKVFICLFWDNKVDKIGWKGCFLGCRRRTIPTALLFESTTVKRQLGVGLHVGCGWSILVANLSFLVSQTLPNLDLPFGGYGPIISPLFFFSDRYLQNDFFWLTPGLKKCRCLYFSYIHLSPISRPVFGLWICFYRNFRTPLPMVPSADSWFFDQAPEQPPKPFRLPDKFWEPTPLQVGMGRTAWNRKKNPKNTRPSRWEELQVTGPFLWGTA